MNPALGGQNAATRQKLRTWSPQLRILGQIVGLRFLQDPSRVDLSRYGSNRLQIPGLRPRPPLAVTSRVDLSRTVQTDSGFLVFDRSPLKRILPQILGLRFLWDPLGTLLGVPESI